ncbi:MAG: peptidyl-prolyl cis-trans isomerase [Acidobacteriota bacterium]|nr:peptidyl-prolyl cis-trans isomerase [Acidobacteriota bacterium]
MRIRLVYAAPRRLFGRSAKPSFLMVPALTLAAMLAGSAAAQIQAPRYQSPIQAPKPQLPGLPVPPAITPNATVVEYPIARVNNQIIDNSDYLRGQRDLLAEAERANATPAEIQARQKDLLRDMIDQQLLLSRGTELAINADSEVVRRLDDIRKQNHMDTMEDLEKAVRQEGLSYEDFKANIKNSIVSQEVVSDEVGRKLSLTARQEQEYYDAHKQEFARPEQVRLSEILIPTPDDATDAQVAQAQAKATEVIGKLKAGAKFVDMAKQYSGGPNADKGGDLGDYCPTGSPASPSCSQLGSKLLDEPVFALQAGQWTAPIRTRQGFVIEQVTEHTPGGIPPLSAVDRQIQEAIYQQAIQPALRKYLTDLREKAYIYIEPGFVDSGASPRETKSVYVGATLPPVKKKTTAKARLDNAHPAPVSTAASTPSTPTAKSNTLTPVKLTKSGKPKKIKREKIRYGQAPRNSLPSAPEETLANGADQGPGATSSLLPGPAPGAAMASADQTASTSSEEDPLAAAAASKGKTRYSDRAPIEAKVKAAEKAAKIKQKVAAAPLPMTAEEKTVQQLQNAPLQQPADKGKKKKVKGAPKERIQEKAPAPPAPKPDANPIPPKSVRDNGEPVVTPSPNPSTLPPVTAPAPGSPVNMTPATPANPAPQPPPSQ